MFSLFSFGAGLSAKRHLSDLLPCRMAMRCGAGQSFKLSACIHSVSLTSQPGSSGSSGSRPFVTVSVGSRTKKTEPGDWRADEGQWYFHESITAEVTHKDELLISVVCPRQYDLGLAAVALSDRCIGDVCVHVASVLPQLQPEERDLEGHIFVTQSINFDLHNEGAKTGRVVISFETKQVPGRDEGEFVR
mmetsp:Transcript_20625/g.64949  ORF Transcript_20625/g.64949 Transcript_20625/m.64949 type:complete len:190 (+) Transcript_20625:88-657(+)